MKKAAGDSRQTQKKPPQTAAPVGPTFKPPLKPRPGLFYAMLGLIGVWVGVLLTLYFVTVYPNRHHQVEPSIEEHESASR